MSVFLNRLRGSKQLKNMLEFANTFKDDIFTNKHKVLLDVRGKDIASAMSNLREKMHKFSPVQDFIENPVLKSLSQRAEVLKNIENPEFTKSNLIEQIIKGLEREKTVLRGFSSGSTYVNLDTNRLHRQQRDLEKIINEYKAYQKNLNTAKEEFQKTVKSYRDIKNRVETRRGFVFMGLPVGVGVYAGTKGIQNLNSNKPEKEASAMDEIFELFEKTSQIIPDIFEKVAKQIIESKKEGV
jgi:hypothetical protein